MKLGNRGIYSKEPDKTPEELSEKVISNKLSKMIISSKALERKGETQ